MNNKSIDNSLLKLELTAEIVSAYVAKNALSIEGLQSVIKSVNASLTQVAEPKPLETLEKPKPAVSIRKSLQHDYLICLEDGKKFKSLKRHLKSRYQMSPQEYRTRWGLPEDYPMVAPAYAEERSRLAKKMGLGKKSND